MSHEQTAAAFAEATASVAEVVREAAEADLGAPTPCGDWDLGALLRHFAGTSGAFAAAAEGALDADDPWGGRVELAPDWSAQLGGNLDRAGAGWSQPATWSSEIGNSSMPTAAVGEMGLIEIVLHGWDLARATGQSVSLSAETAAEVLRCAAATAEQGREYEVYGPAVEIPANASDLDKALGLTGRDPAWSA